MKLLRIGVVLLLITQTVTAGVLYLVCWEIRYQSGQILGLQALELQRQQEKKAPKPLPTSLPSRN
jgi:hypothetical protein